MVEGEVPKTCMVQGEKGRRNRRRRWNYGFGEAGMGAAMAGRGPMGYRSAVRVLPSAQEVRGTLGPHTGLRDGCDTCNVAGEGREEICSVITFIAVLNSSADLLQVPTNGPSTS
ncbi:hypothetical protein B0H14DRAFT_2566616 [Mycena olivaceomarginata]|nr:hypothetical protein B0H14DRAFT_2566616 [Mycena olivaceomarginata]